MDRSREEEEEEELNKSQVKEFMRLKSVQKAALNILPWGSRLDTTPAVPVPMSEPFVNYENTEKQNMLAHKTNQQAMCLTDEDNLDPGSPFSRLINMQRGTLGQGNRSPRDTLYFPTECLQVQHEYPLMKT
jgi:hypothetical protein